MKQVLEEHFGRIDLDVCRQIMRDHAGWPGSICRHYRPGDERVTRTQAALIYVPAEGKMLASDGPPCGAPFVEYSLMVSPVPAMS
jgi:hypothetical protein